VIRGPLLALAVLAGCGFESRSDAFACDADHPCADDRVCQRGWCVVPGGGGEADAMTSEIDAFVCPDACDDCDDGVCNVRCDGDGDCDEAIVCPPGLPCHVRCGGVGSCGGGIDCRDATACEIDCTSPQACQGKLACGEGRCEIDCDDDGTCSGGVECGDACACELDCSGSDACVDTACRDGACETPSNGCDLTPSSICGDRC
jgi:hypothetical protein